MTLEGIDSLARRALAKLLSGENAPPLRIVLWDGSELGREPRDALGTVRIHDRKALLRILADPEMQLCELYVEGRLGIEGDMIAIVTAALRSRMDKGLLGRLMPNRWLEAVHRQGMRIASRNAQRHYDVGNDFYELWLDERMVYTCAYFPTPAVSLEEAQVAKMNHVCRKLALRSGERVIEAGCGWGALALHMAREFGVRVRAFNVSRAQLEYAREQAEKQGLADRVEFIEDDYRNATGRCDAFVSVGMLEHVGARHYPDLGAVIDRCLEPDGRGLIHSIGRHRPMRLNRWIASRVFPNAQPPSLGQMMRIFEPQDFSILDVENLRLHYALTARHWLARFEASQERIRELVGEELARTWRLYLAGTVASFDAARLQLFQVVFARAESGRIPWTRSHVYLPGPAGALDDGFGEAAEAAEESRGGL